MRGAPSQLTTEQKQILDEIYTAGSSQNPETINALLDTFGVLATTELLEGVPNSFEHIDLAKKVFINLLGREFHLVEKDYPGQPFLEELRTFKKGLTAAGVGADEYDEQAEIYFRDTNHANNEFYKFCIGTANKGHADNLETQALNDKNKTKTLFQASTKIPGTLEPYAIVVSSPHALMTQIQNEHDFFERNKDKLPSGVNPAAPRTFYIIYNEGAGRDSKGQSVNYGHWVTAQVNIGMEEERNGYKTRSFSLTVFDSLGMAETYIDPKTGKERVATDRNGRHIKKPCTFACDYSTLHLPREYVVSSPNYEYHLTNQQPRAGENTCGLWAACNTAMLIQGNHLYPHTTETKLRTTLFHTLESHYQNHFAAHNGHSQPVAQPATLPDTNVVGIGNPSSGYPHTIAQPAHPSKGSAGQPPRRGVTKSDVTPCAPPRKVPFIDYTNSHHRKKPKGGGNISRLNGHGESPITNGTHKTVSDLATHTNGSQAAEPVVVVATPLVEAIPLVMAIPVQTPPAQPAAGNGSPNGQSLQASNSPSQQNAGFANRVKVPRGTARCCSVM